MPFFHVVLFCVLSNSVFVLPGIHIHYMNMSQTVEFEIDFCAGFSDGALDYLFVLPGIHIGYMNIYSLYVSLFYDTSDYLVVLPDIHIGYMNILNFVQTDLALTYIQQPYASI